MQMQSTAAKSILTLGVRRLPRIHVRDKYFLLVTGLAIFLSLASFVYFYTHGYTLLYFDAQARLLITRRVVDSPTAGFAQLGAVWLPLTHVLALPLIGNDFLYRSGIALSVFSMISYVLTGIFVYKILLVLTNDRVTGFIGAFIVLSNPNMLYMQATPMTEMPMYASMIANVYYLLRLSREPENRVWYFLCGFTITLSCVIRYEGWMLLLAEVPVLVYIFLRKKFALSKIEGLLIYWAYWAFAGIGGWLVWNQLIFGDPFTFQRGEYAKPSNWVSVGDPVIGHLNTSFFTYGYAMLLSVGPIVFLGILGLIYYLLRTRLRGDSVAPLTLLAMFPAFVIMLDLGQRPLSVPQIAGYMYNIRFALVMLLPVAIFVAYLGHRRPLLKGLVFVASVGMLILLLKTDGVITLAEPLFIGAKQQHTEDTRVANWLKQNYDGQSMLVESYGNDQIEFESGIPLRNLIYEGSYRLWDLALANPQNYVAWVLMRNEYVENGSIVAPADKTWLAFHNQPTFHENYDLVYKNETHEIYRRRASPVKDLTF